MDGEQMAEMFIQYSRNVDETHHLFVYDDGSVQVDDKQMDRKQAVAFVEDIRSDGMVVLLIGGSYGRKAEKTLQALCKSVKKLVEQRSKSGIDYDTYPVLTTTRADYTRIMKKVREAAKELVPSQQEPVAIDTTVVIEELEPEAVAKPKTQARAGTKAKRRPVSETNEVPSSATKSVHLGAYEVHVKTTLSVRNKPSASAAKLGSLQNGEQVSVEGFVDGWARITYEGKLAYVKAEYIVPCTESTPADSSDDAGSYKIWKLILQISPLLIVIFLVLACVCDGNAANISIAATGLMELLYCAADQRVNISGLAWFCMPGKVGWIMTIIDFIILIGVLIAQHEMFKATLSNMLNNAGRRGFSYIFLFLVSYPLFAVVGITLAGALLNPGLFWAPLLAIGVLCLFFKWIVDTEWTVAFVMALWAGVSFGGFLAFFLSVAGVLILGGLIYILVSAVANGSSSGTQTSASSSNGNSQSTDNTQGCLERDAFGGTHVRHPDGTTTDLTDVGNGEFVDYSGHSWRKGMGRGKDMYRW